MSRLFPYPLLAVSLLVMWLLLQQSLSLGHFLLGGVIAMIASQAVAALQPEPPRIRHPLKIVKLVWLVTLDIIRSNIAVTRIILLGQPRNQNKGFLVVPLKLTNNYGLVILACIVTATPGSAWIEYNAARSTVLIHVFDLVDDNAWIEMLKNRYEILLLEIFE
ncbi:MAG TPA: Na+/H+ antiporter subunit E [Opitutus sp.]|nr:Na+/H+ antiporter subunit E [Opitutus sp.]